VRVVTHDSGGISMSRLARELLNDEIEPTSLYAAQRQKVGCIEKSE
jgi:hypothetical protein